MQFTPQELRLIERLRKRERQWRWSRWALLGLSLMAFGCYGYVGISLYHRLHWEALTTEDVALIAIYWPKILLGIVMGTLFAVLPLANWQGNATRMLVLKLLDAQGQKADDESRG